MNKLSFEQALKISKSIVNEYGYGLYVVCSDDDWTTAEDSECIAKAILDFTENRKKIHELYIYQATFIDMDDVYVFELEPEESKVSITGFHLDGVHTFKVCRSWLESFVQEHYDMTVEEFLDHYDWGDGEYILQAWRDQHD